MGAKLNIFWNVLYLFLIIYNYSCFIVFISDSVHGDQKKIANQSYPNLIFIITLELIMLCFISAFMLTASLISRLVHTAILNKSNDEVLTQSRMHFMMQMPLFYYMRLPLILGIITNIALLIDPEDVKVRWGRDERPVKFKSLKRYIHGYLKTNPILMNLSET